MCGFWDGIKSGIDDLTSGNWSGVAQGIGEFSSDYLAPKGIPHYNLLTGETKTPEGLPGQPSGIIYAIKEGVKDVPSLIPGAAKELAGQFWDVLTKYWYVPVIIGGVVVGHYLVKNKNGRAQIIRYIAAQ